jgi:hypothetical protein
VRKVKEVYAVGAEDTSDRVDVDYGFALTTGVEERGREWKRWRRLLSVCQYFFYGEICVKFLRCVCVD